MDHPSIGGPKAAEDPAVDVKNLRKTLIEVIEGGSDAVVVCHSYGGMVTSCATEGLGKKDRLSKGEKHGVVNVLYMCVSPNTRVSCRSVEESFMLILMLDLQAFALPQGVSLMNALNDTPLPWFDMRDVSQCREDMMSFPSLTSDVYLSLGRLCWLQRLRKDLLCRLFTRRPEALHQPAQASFLLVGKTDFKVEEQS